MIISRSGEEYSIVRDEAIEEVFAEHNNYVAKYQIEVRSLSGMFEHIAKAGSRDGCLRGLLDSGFSILKSEGE